MKQDALKRFKTGIYLRLYESYWRMRGFAGKDRMFIKRLADSGISIETVWDGGASNGAWAALACRNLPIQRVELFEPLAPFDRDYSKLLNHRLQAKKNWRLHPVALGDTNSEITIFKTEDAVGSSCIESEFARDNWTSIDVTQRTVDHIVQSGEARPPDIIKADIQGFELRMLKGAEQSLKDTKALILESWFTRGYGAQTPLLSELTKWLSERGFILVDTAGEYYSPDGWVLSLDAFFVSRGVAESCGYYIEGAIS